MRFTVNEQDARPLVVKCGDLNDDQKNDMVVSLHGVDKIAVFLGEANNLPAPCGIDSFGETEEEDGYYGDPEKE